MTPSSTDAKKEETRKYSLAERAERGKVAGADLLDPLHGSGQHHRVELTHSRFSRNKPAG
jgi:hypothetical protein